MVNFTMSELLHSDEALKHKIQNIPQQPYILDNMLLLMTECLQPIRDVLKKPMIITSGFRNEKVNSLVGGKSNSQHLTGQAVDFIVPGMTPQAVIDVIKKSGVVYDQLIKEYNQWVHISYRKADNRKQYLIIN